MCGKHLSNQIGRGRGRGLIELILHLQANRVLHKGGNGKENQETIGRAKIKFKRPLSAKSRHRRVTCSRLELVQPSARSITGLFLYTLSHAHTSRLSLFLVATGQVAAAAAVSRAAVGMDDFGGLVFVFF